MFRHHYTVLEEAKLAEVSSEGELETVYTAEFKTLLACGDWRFGVYDWSIPKVPTDEFPVWSALTIDLSLLVGMR